MLDSTAKSIETSGNSGTVVAFVAALSVWSGQTVMWLNENYMAVIAVCTLITTAIGAYGSLVRIRLAKSKAKKN